jgi:two-component system nitrogen regulation sensor histidine kinase GlnL
MTDRVLGNLTTAVLLLNDDLTIAFANQAAEDLLHDSIGRLSAHRITDFVANGSDLAEIARSASESQQRITRRKMPLLLPGHEEVTVDITVTPVMDSGQSLVEMIPMDRYLRIDRDAAIKEHHEVTRQMVRGLAHEIKNPLGGIKGSAQLLDQQLPDDAMHEYTNIIIEETDRLSALVDRMLGPNTLPDRKVTNIHEVLERVGRLVELEASDRITVVRDYDPSIPEVEIDPEQMTQAVLNIARNAMQSLADTPHPTITFTSRIERQFTIAGKRHKVAVRLEVSDNGPGIPETIQEHLFYPMISGRPEGTGLGLTFAHSIIHQHAGLIEFTSEPGNTSFRIFIPLEQDNVA